MIIKFVLLSLCASVSFTADTARSSPVKCFGCQNVKDPSSCNTVTTCMQDQVCSVEEMALSSNITTYNFGCANKHPCVEITRFVLENTLFGGTTIIGKRFSNGLKSCSICCGDSLCNNEGCFELTSKLWNGVAGRCETLRELSKNGHLNLETLSYKP